MEFTPTIKSLFDAVFITRILSIFWLAGCLLGLKFLATAARLASASLGLPRVTDAALLGLLEKSRRRIGLKRSPALLVTPESQSPCIVGTWNPRIVLPESVVTEASATRLRHVLAHELAHLVRGDLWANWLLLAARILHGFKPVAWWRVREMQAEREAACDEWRLAALGETDRSAYAATIVELAASLTPSAIAPGLVGLFSSTCRLKARVERLLRSPSVTTLRAPIAASLLVGMALIGLTDTMPGAQAQAPKAAAPAATAKEEPNENTPHRQRTLFQSSRSHGPGRDHGAVVSGGRTNFAADGGCQDSHGCRRRYAFKGIEPPRPENHLDRLNYGVFGFAADRPIGISFSIMTTTKGRRTADGSRKGDPLGKVIDAAGDPCQCDRAALPSLIGPPPASWRRRRTPRAVRSITSGPTNGPTASGDHQLQVQHLTTPKRAGRRGCRPMSLSCCRPVAWWRARDGRRDRNARGERLSRPAG
jgi:beta-lactamase regulating signal transducer with metallopeptidase domain